MEITKSAARIAHLPAQLDAELRLTAGPLQKKDHASGDIKCGEVVQIVLDHCQRHIDPRGNARGCPDVVRGDKDRVGLDRYCRILALEQVAEGPVRCSHAAIKDAEFGENKRPSAYGPEPTRKVEIFG